MANILVDRERLQAWVTFWNAARPQKSELCEAVLDDMRGALDGPHVVGLRRVIVNAREHWMPAQRLSYGDVVRLAGGLSTWLTYTVTYDDGGKGGTLRPGEGDSVGITDGMIFDVTDTGKA